MIRGDIPEHPAMDEIRAALLTKRQREQVEAIQKLEGKLGLVREWAEGWQNTRYETSSMREIARQLLAILDS